MSRRGIFNATAVYCIVGILAGLAFLFFGYKAIDNYMGWTGIRAGAGKGLIMDNPIIYAKTTEYLLQVFLGCLAIVFGAITACKSFSLIYHRRHESHRDSNTFTFVLAIAFLILLCIGLAIFTAGIQLYGVHMGGWFILFASVAGFLAGLYCDYAWYRALQLIASVLAVAIGIYGVINPPYLNVLLVA